MQVKGPPEPAALPRDHPPVDAHVHDQHEGTIQSKPNIFGGKDYRLPNGDQIESRPNIFGGQNFRQPNGHVVECHPNIFGGEDCR